METKNMEPQSNEVVSLAAPWLRRMASGFAEAVPLAIIVLGILLLQSHSLRFWDMAVGPWVGWGWSVLLELISLWLWYRPRSGVIAWWVWRAVALTTTGLLLTGPLYQVSAPLFAQGVHEEELAQQIARAERSLETYQENSRIRAGWQGKIDQTEAELGRLWSERWQTADQNRSKPGIVMGWQREAIIFLQVVSILVVQAAVVLAITTVSNSGQRTTRNFNTATGSTCAMGTQLASATDPPRLIVTLQEAIRRRLATGQSYAEIEKQTGIPKPYLSLLMNHFERAKRGDRVLGEQALRQLASRLGLT